MGIADFKVYSLLIYKILNILYIPKFFKNKNIGNIPKVQKAPRKNRNRTEYFLETCQ